MSRRDEVLSIFRERGAYLEGHFELSSGLHSGRYIQAAMVLQYPEEAARLSASLASLFEDLEVSVVISPAIGGIVLGQKVAELLGTRAIFAEREGGILTLRRGFGVYPGEKVLIVEDVITTGSSVSDIVGLVESAASVLVGVGCLVDRSGGMTSFGRRSSGGTASKIIFPKSLARLKVQAYRKSECPFCRQGLPLSRPGSRVRQG